MEMKFEPTKPWHATSAALTEILDRTYKALKDQEPRRKYLGASLIGHHCERYLGYQFHQVPQDGEGFSGRLYRIFDRGHKGEDRVAEYLRVAGFDLRTAREDGSQFGFSAAGGRIAGHIDGVFLSGPLEIPYPCLWENKILNNKSFCDLHNNGLEKSKPIYFGQVQLYMAYMNVGHTLFTAENADTCEVYGQVVPFDPAFAQALSDKAVRVVSSADPEELPRCAKEKTDYRCRFCNFRETCWTPQQQAAPSAPAIRPPWL